MKWYSTQCSEMSILSTFCALCIGCFIDYHIGQNGAQNEGLILSNYCITGVALMEENESRIMEGWHAIPLVSQVQNSTSFYNRTQRQPNFCWTLPLKVIIKKNRRIISLSWYTKHSRLNIPQKLFIWAVLCQNMTKNSTKCPKAHNVRTDGFLSVIEMNSRQN